MEFKSLASCSPSSGNSFLLWHDNGIEPCIKHRFPQLHSFSRKSKGSIRHLLDGEINKIFSLPLSVQASNQLIPLINGHTPGTQKCLVSRKLIVYCKVLRKLLLSFSWLWSSGNPGKHKFFSWLLLKDRLNTRSLLRRKNMALEYYNCAICSLGTKETSIHIFFECPFSCACWNYIGIQWNLPL